ncbi:nicotinate (nicotinamide) nucleotide adenylyltransferase [Ferruginibacter sp. HRS2-29]|uniref:nicotinate (nicotinamide) nucleotide adenylyltransferase n=1 Tax=Ferruginibacter sp. HRS2-29 TaxID=2487334 RepID=UPI0020CC8A17|nr:nicotinate (nicotinamide) nucleotide adenylyltransferase [Ferruginibacter sp. HRS2-29]MCP9749574.1 nicotinate-nucleotide adenylyltransferase [Ferruginibacter sp. HRS2-29]
MKIGLYFGSFNPIHTGHLIIASHMANTSELNEVWLVVSPQNPFKRSAGLLNEHHRIHLVNTALEGEHKIKASSVEFKLPKPSYTIDTLTYLSEKYPQHQFSIIMGSDGFQNIEKWKNAALLLKSYKIYIYKRPGFDVQVPDGAAVEIVDAPLLEISSTRIRELIKKGKSIRYLVTDAVKEEIEKNNYYGNSLENPAE